ncbi:hypothetical protein PUATCC27989T_00513 [Phytobacter ursingii]|nr:hypothetical protein PUATCC27989T_00513 [Phytobacter ursingii]
MEQFIAGIGGFALMCGVMLACLLIAALIIKK